MGLVVAVFSARLAGKPFVPPVKGNEVVPPVLCSTMLTVASFAMLNVQVMTAPAATLPAAIVSVDPASVPNDDTPSVQLALVSAQPDGTVCVMAVEVPFAVTT